MGISIYPTALRAFVRQLAHSDLPNLRSNGDYAGFLEEYSSGAFLSVTETQYVVRSLFATIQGAVAEVLLGMDGGSAGEGNSEAPAHLPIPGVEVVDKYFDGIIGTAVEADEEGILFKCIVR